MLNLLLVEDNDKLRAALKPGLEATGDVLVTQTCDSGEAALTHCLAATPQVILMDVQLAGKLNGIEAAVAIRREFPRLPVVFYSIQDDDSYYRDFRRSGILSHYAYVRKSNYLLPEMIAPLLRDAVAGRSFVDPDIEDRIQEVRQRSSYVFLVLRSVAHEYVPFLGRILYRRKHSVNSLESECLTSTHHPRRSRFTQRRRVHAVLGTASTVCSDLADEERGRSREERPAGHGEWSR